MVLTDIKIIVWDFDGTLWRDYELGKIIKSKYIEFINKRVDFPLSVEEFDRASAKHGRWSKTVSMLTQVLENDVLNEVEKMMDIAEYLKKDVRLVNNLERLKGFRHLILTNSSEKQVMKGLKKIGFKNNHGLKYYPFEKIFARENLPFLKPHPIAFKEVIGYSHELPSRHLLIGDSYDDDILPAKKFGLKAIHIDEASKYLNLK